MFIEPFNDISLLTINLPSIVALSLISNVLALTVVVVPLTIKLPDIVVSPPTFKSFVTEASPPIKVFLAIPKPPAI